MQLYIAIVTHAHGVNGYAGLTDADVKEQVAGFAREWCGHLPADTAVRDEIQAACDRKDWDTAIRLYFEAAEGESVVFADADLANGVSDACDATL